MSCYYEDPWGNQLNPSGSNWRRIWALEREKREAEEARKAAEAAREAAEEAEAARAASIYEAARDKHAAELRRVLEKLKASKGQ